MNQNTATIKLQFDETVDPPNHIYKFEISENQRYQISFHFNEGKGYIGVNYIRWFGTDLISTSQGATQAPIPNLMPCRYSDEMWDALPYEERLWKQRYPSDRCDGKRDYVAPEDRPKKRINHMMNKW